MPPPSAVCCARRAAKSPPGAERLPLLAALGHGGVEGLLLQPVAQRAVRLRPDDAIELAPVARDEAHAADHNVVDLPAPVAHVQAVVERDLGAALGDDLRAHEG